MVGHDVPGPAIALRVSAVFLTLIALAAPTATAADHPHHIALFAGYATESKPPKDDVNGFALGLEYVYRFHSSWGIGGVIEGLGQDTIRNVLVVVPVSWHPVAGLRLVAGPGMEFTPKKDKWALRIGAGYNFHLSDHWSLSPELFLDLIETGENTWVAGLALGYGF